MGLVGLVCLLVACAFCVSRYTINSTEEVKKIELETGSRLATEPNYSELLRITKLEDMKKILAQKICSARKKVLVKHFLSARTDL